MISADNLSLHTSILASDAFEGRFPNSEFTGEKLTMKYLQDQFQKLPGAEVLLQEVPLNEITQSSTSNLNINFNSNSEEEVLSFEPFTDYVVSSKCDKIDINDVEMIFCGYGIVDQKYDWNDFKQDVYGKIIVVLCNDPGFRDPSLFQGKNVTYSGRWTYKYEEAVRMGALGVFIIHTTESAGYPFSVLVRDKDIPKIILNSGQTCKVEGWLNEESSRKIFKYSGITYEEALILATNRDFQPINLNCQCQLSLITSSRPIKSHNFIGLFRGKVVPEEVIIYTAHWDHFGKTSNNDIYNGARDNALSVAGLLEIARCISEKVNKDFPKRSIMLLSPTAEEHNLLGSRYYTENPLFPMSKTIAVFNMDLLNIFGKTSDCSFFGFGKSDLDDMAVEQLTVQNRTLSPDPNPTNGMYYRSDHFNFVKKGVPSLFIYMGFNHIEKGWEWLININNEWTSECYHTPKDIYMNNKTNKWCWDLTGASEDICLIMQIGILLAGNIKLYPKWKNI